MKCLCEWVEMKSKEEEEKNERRRKLSIVVEEERTVFLTAACISAGADVLGAQVVDHNLRWNDLVILYVEEEENRCLWDAGELVV